MKGDANRWRSRSAESLTAWKRDGLVNNDCRLDQGDVYDLCVPDTVASPLVIGERQGLGQSLGVFHGCFWVVPRPVLDRVGLLDERFARAYWEDDDFVARVRLAGFAIRQLDSVRVRHVGGLTTVKVPEHRDWLVANERRFEEKWGSLPPPNLLTSTITWCVLV